MPEGTGETPRSPGTSQDDLEEYFGEITSSGALPGGQWPEVAATAVMCTLLQRLLPSAVADLTAALPPSLQNLFTPCLAGRTAEVETFDRAEFLRRVSERLLIPAAQAEILTHTVLEATRRRLPENEATDVELELPADLRDLWGAVTA